MQEAATRRATQAASTSATSAGLSVDEVVVVQNSNKLALRLLPCDVLARVAPASHAGAQSELELAAQLLEAGCPMAAPEPRVEPRVHHRDGYAVTFWTYYESRSPRDLPPSDYAGALATLHAGMRTLDVEAPHFTERVDEARRLVASRADTPALPESDRRLLADTLRDTIEGIGRRSTVEQLLHGEPHPGNLLDTAQGLLFIDLETCCRGPVEFDLAHAPVAVGDRYPGVDRGLLRACRLLVLAMITTWRWDRADEFPDGQVLGAQWLDQIRAARRSDGWEDLA